MSREESGEKRWERRDVDVISIAMIAGLLVIGVILTVLITGGTLRLLSRHRAETDVPPPAVARDREEFPGPRLQTSSAADWEKYRAAEVHELTSYGWVDREKNIVRIPIERAIELLSQRGLPQVGGRLTPAQLQQQRPLERSQNNAP